MTKFNIYDKNSTQQKVGNLLSTIKATYEKLTINIITNREGKKCFSSKIQDEEIISVAASIQYSAGSPHKQLNKKNK